MMRGHIMDEEVRAAGLLRLARSSRADAGIAAYEAELAQLSGSFARQDECLRLLYGRYGEERLPEGIGRLTAGLAGLCRRDVRQARRARLAAAAAGILLLAGAAAVGGQHWLAGGRQSGSLMQLLPLGGADLAALPAAAGGPAAGPGEADAAPAQPALPAGLAVDAAMAAPDLSGMGYALIESRVLAGPAPAVQFAYADPAGGRAWLYVSPNPEGASGPALLAQEGPLSVVIWRDDALSYSLVAEADRAAAMRIGDLVRSRHAAPPEAAPAADDAPPAGGDVQDVGATPGQDAEDGPGGSLQPPLAPRGDSTPPAQDGARQPAET
jgi:hypothetical protein